MMDMPTTKYSNSFFGVFMSSKISLASCNGMSANGLISRVAVSDCLAENENLISICITATSTDKPSFINLINKFPIIAVNGCCNNCVNSILKSKSVEVYQTIVVEDLIKNENISPYQIGRLDKKGERAVKIVKDKIEEILQIDS